MRWKMYYHNGILKESIGERIVQAAIFFVSGWGMIKKNDLKLLFRLDEKEYIDMKHHLHQTRRCYTLEINTDGDIYAMPHEGYQPAKKYINVLSVFAQLMQRHKDEEIQISSETHSTLFLAEMLIRKKDGTIQTYHALDTAFYSLPFYALQDALESEIADWNDRKNHRIIIVVYPETDVWHLDIDFPVFFAQRKEKNQLFDFFNNDRVPKEREVEIWKSPYVTQDKY